RHAYLHHSPCHGHRDSDRTWWLWKDVRDDSTCEASARRSEGRQSWPVLRLCNLGARLGFCPIPLSTHNDGSAQLEQPGSDPAQCSLSASIFFYAGSPCAHWLHGPGRRGRQVARVRTTIRSVQVEFCRARPYPPYLP